MKLTNVHYGWDDELKSFYKEETYTHKCLIDLPGNDMKRVLKLKGIKIKL